MSDPQKVTQQAALTTASGRTWLIVAAVIAALCLILLWLLKDLEPLGAATVGMVVIVIAYLAMIAVRFGVAAPRLRLWTLAILTLSIAGTFMTVAITMIYSS